jgi:hypothetical protein
MLAVPLDPARLAGGWHASRGTLRIIFSNKKYIEKKNEKK